MVTVDGLVNQHPCVAVDLASRFITTLSVLISLVMWWLLKKETRKSCVTKGETWRRAAGCQAWQSSLQAAANSRGLYSLAPGAHGPASSRGDAAKQATTRADRAGGAVGWTGGMGSTVRSRPQVLAGGAKAVASRGRVLTLAPSPQLKLRCSAYIWPTRRMWQRRRGRQVPINALKSGLGQHKSFASLVFWSMLLRC